MCILGVFILQCQFGLVIRSFGIIYLLLLEHYKTTASLAAWVGALNVLMYGVSGPVGSILCSKIGHRITAIIGCLLQALGFIICGYAPNIAVVYIGFGVFLGTGISISTVSCFLILDQYFHKKKAMAVSLGCCGIGVMMFVVGPLMGYLQEQYGYSGTMLLLGGICLQGIVSGALFRPVPQKLRPENNISITLNVSTINESTCESNCTNKPQSKNQINDEDNPEKIETKLFIKNKLTNDTDTPSISSSKLKYRLRKILKKIKDNPSIFGLSLVQICVPICDSCIYGFLPAMAIDNNVSITNASLLISWAGLSDSIHRIAFGVIMDINTVRPSRVIIYSSFGIVSSIITMILPFCSGYYILIIPVILFGGFIGAFFAQRVTMVSDIVGARDTPTMFGMVMTLNAGGHVTGRLLGGVIKDYTGSYDLLFYSSGIFSTVCSIVFLMILIYLKIKNNTRS